jgi:hypothetical protein
MTDEEFDKTFFNSSAKVKFFGDSYRIVQVDFDERLIGIHEFLDDATVTLISADSVELVTDN